MYKIDRRGGGSKNRILGQTPRVCLRDEILDPSLPPINFVHYQLIIS